MEDKTVLEKIAKLKKESKKRNFSQKFDLVISLKEFNIKKGDKIDDYVLLSNTTGKNCRFCALVGNELVEQAKKFCDTTILVDDFAEWENPRKIRKLVRSHDYFIAQANLMASIAKTFGKYLGSKGKMPNPKLGLVVAPNGNIEDLIKRLRNTVILKATKQPSIQVTIGNEEMKDEEILGNIKVVADKIIKDLPKGKHQIKHIMLKLTMSKPEILE